MAFRSASDPGILYRIGRNAAPLAFPPLSRLGSGRFDDPRARCSVLYAAVERRAAFMETLDPFRADLLSLAERNARIGAPTDDDDFVGGIIPGKYLDRCIATFTVAPGQQWLDVRSPETHAVLRRELASELRKLSSIPRFVLGDLFSHDHGVTRMVAGWAIDHGFHGVAYASCHDISLTCWAIFEGAEITPLDSPKRVDRDDPDLLAVAQMWNLQIPTGNPASRFD